MKYIKQIENNNIKSDIKILLNLFTCGKKKIKQKTKNKK